MIVDFMVSFMLSFECTLQTNLDTSSRESSWLFLEKKIYKKIGEAYRTNE